MRTVLAKITATLMLSEHAVWVTDSRGVRFLPNKIRFEAVYGTREEVLVYTTVLDGSNRNKMYFPNDPGLDQWPSPPTWFAQALRQMQRNTITTLG